MYKIIKRLVVVVIAICCFYVSGSLKQIPLFHDNIASAKTFYWKYSKMWIWTSGVKSLGKKPIHKTKNKKYKATVYRVYVSKGDIKAKYLSGLSLIGGLAAGKAVAIVTSLVGDNLSDPKHGIRYDLQMVNSKVTYSWNYHKWK